MKEPLSSDPELDALGRELRRLPTPLPSQALVSRVRRLGHLRLAEREAERGNRLVLGFLLLFSWACSLLVLFVVPPAWAVAYLVATWISDAVVLVLLGAHVRKARRLA